LDNASFQLKVAIFKALAHPVRLRISEELLGGEKCVCDLVALFNFDRTTISKHLAVLKSAGVIRDRKEGLFVFYSLNLECLGMMIGCISKSIENELRDHLDSLDSAKFEIPVKRP
jgi:ArsR family transcriptional regulator